MNQKAFKKQLSAISSKDEGWQGFLGSTVPNRIDDPKPDAEGKTKEERTSKKEKKDKDSGFSEAAAKVTKNEL